MQNFEQCLFSGLDQDQYQILWVQHQDKINQDTEQTRLELNFCDTECRTFYRKTATAILCTSGLRSSRPL